MHTPDSDVALASDSRYAASQLLGGAIQPVSEDVAERDSPSHSDGADTECRFNGGCTVGSEVLDREGF